MRLSSQAKSISCLKAHTSEIVRTLGDHGESLVVPQNGEAKVVAQDIDSSEKTHETKALPKILALGTGRSRPGSAPRTGCDRAPTGALMAFRVLLTDSAARDLEEASDYIERHDSLAQAEYVQDQVESALQSLSEHPKRGCYLRGVLSKGLP